MNVSVRHLCGEKGEEMTEEGYEGVNSVMIQPERMDVRAFSSRIFRIKPDGHTSMHAHPREHIAVVVEGMCRVEYDDEVIEVEEGGIVNIPSNVPHRFTNPSKDLLVLLIMNIHTG